jgi:hypothetical protein
VSPHTNLLSPRAHPVPALDGGPGFAAIRLKKAPLAARGPRAILQDMVTYRVIGRGPEKFVLEARTDEHGTWRFIDEFRSLREAKARMARLEQILRTSLGELG